MLKRIGYIALSLVLLATTIGVVVSEHYCQDDLISVSFFVDADACCDMDNCCHNETLVYQLKTDFSMPAASAIPVLAEHHTFGNDFFVEENFYQTVYLSHKIIEASPPSAIQRTLCLKQSFLL